MWLKELKSHEAMFKNAGKNMKLLLYCYYK